MDRRTFLTRFPVALTGGVTSMLLQAEVESPERQALRGLLEQSTRSYEQARNLIHYPWRYDEAHPLLDAALEDAAQVWLRLRGVHSLEEKCHTWTFVACNVRDSISGVAWNEAMISCRLLSRSCDGMGRLFRTQDVNPTVRSTLQGKAQADLGIALDNVAQCLECTRMVLEQRRGEFPALPPAPRY